MGPDFHVLVLNRGKLAEQYHRLCKVCGLHSNILLSCGMTYIYHLDASSYKLLYH